MLFPSLRRKRSLQRPRAPHKHLRCRSCNKPTQHPVHSAVILWFAWMQAGGLPEQSAL
jgi:hypothetical protein